MFFLIGLIITAQAKTLMLPPQPFPTMEACQMALELVEPPVAKPGSPDVAMWSVGCMEFHLPSDKVTL